MSMVLEKYFPLSNKYLNYILLQNKVSHLHALSLYLYFSLLFLLLIYTRQTSTVSLRTNLRNVETYI